VHAIESRVLQGRKLRPLGGIDEGAVLGRLTKVAQAYHLAKNRLAEAGFDDAVDLHAERKRAAAARTKQMYAGRGGGATGAAAPAAGAGAPASLPSAAASSRKADNGHRG
jgi:hypothetical protein